MAAETWERERATLTRHMQRMFSLYAQSGEGAAPRGKRLTAADVRAAYYAGFVEGLWTERVRTQTGGYDGHDA